VPALACERVETSTGPEAAFVFPARRGRMRLALTPTRVVATSAAGTVELPWTAIGAVRVDTGVLGLAASRPGAAVWTRGRWLGWLNRRASPYAVSFKATAFVAEAQAIVRAIERYRDDARRRRSIGSDKEHARLLRELGETAARA
jgi:hypothetical protein